MATQAEAHTLAAVASQGDQSERGRKVAEVRVALGLSKSELAKRAHVDRATLDRIESGSGGVRDTSLAAVERVLAELDEEMSPPPSVEGSIPPGRVVRFTVKGVYGAESLVVEGPVENIAELEQAVDRIMRRLQKDEP
jgi:transcriptional regulator with XRE-family HTH domain